MNPHEASPTLLYGYLYGYVKIALRRAGRDKSWSLESRVCRLFPRLFPLFNHCKMSGSYYRIQQSTSSAWSTRACIKAYSSTQQQNSIIKLGFILWATGLNATGHFIYNQIWTAGRLVTHKLSLLFFNICRLSPANIRLKITFSYRIFLHLWKTWLLWCLHISWLPIPRGLRHYITFKDVGFYSACR